MPEFKMAVMTIAMVFLAVSWLIGNIGYAIIGGVLMAVAVFDTPST